jgi:hypothetical protein
LGYTLTGIDPAFFGSLAAQAFGGLTIAVAFQLLAASACQHVGSWLMDRMFDAGLALPTTTFLLDGDGSVTPERKKLIIDKIDLEFGVNLVGRTADTRENRRLIHETVGLVRRKFWKKNEAVLMRNVRFGFAKNLAGGAIVALLVTVLIFVVAYIVRNLQAGAVATGLMVWYAVLILYGTLAMRSNAPRYAHTLYDEFLAS